MKTLKLFDHLVPLVLSGEKKSTWRMFDDKDLRVGDELSLVNKSTGEEFASARITAIKEKRLGGITDADFVGHERFESSKKMFEAYKKYYGDRVTLDTPVKMITFELRGP